MKRILFPLLTFLAISTTPFLVMADIPKTINYQGRLTDLNGNTVEDSTPTLTVRLYANESDPIGSALWTGVYPATTKNGYFNLDLGSGSYPFSASLDFNQLYFVGIQINSDSEMIPRQSLKSVPYALNVANGIASNNWVAENSSFSFTASDVDIEKNAIVLPITLDADADVIIHAKSVVNQGTGIRRVFYRIYLDSTLIDHTDIGHSLYLESFYISAIGLTKGVTKGSHTIYLKVLMGDTTVFPITISDSKVIVEAKYK